MDDTKQTAHLIGVGEVMAGYVVAFWRGSTRSTVSRFGWLNPGGRTAAQAATRGGWARKPGYQVRNVSSHPSFNTRVRICSRRWAPRLVYCICCFFTMRLLTTWFTVDSTKPVLMRSP
jgi:hypothetical protein